MKKVLLLSLLLVASMFLFAENFTIELHDAYGDGWNGGMADVTVAGALVLDDITIDTGDFATFTFAVNDGDEVVIDYTEGGWAYENSYVILDNALTAIYESPAPPEASYSFTVVVASSDTGTISGFVTDGTDPIEGATIITGAYSAVSAADGSYTLADVFIGNYDVACSATGFFGDIQNVDVTVGNTTALDFVLEVFMGNECGSAIVVGEVTDYPFDTTQNTTSGFDTHSINQDAWYVYTATSDGTMTVDLCGSSFDTKIAIYGACDVATELGYNDDSAYCNTRNAQSAVQDIPVVSGNEYFIQVGGFGSYYGAGDLTIVLTPTTTTVDYSVDLIDAYGDGWDGALLTVTVAGTVVLDAVTAEGTGSSFVFPVTDGDEVVFDYTPGNYESEHSYVINNELAEVIYTSPNPPELVYSFIVGAVETMDYNVALIDSYGDGWDGALLSVTVAGTLALDAVTAEGTGSSFVFTVADGDEVVFDYTPGNFESEHSYVISNELAVPFYTSPNPPELVYTFIVGSTTPAPAVFFSEYIEGSSNNKAMEIYNGTAEEIDLANYRINQASNGGDWEYIHTFPEGAILAAGDTWVIAADGLSSDYYPEALCDEFLGYPSVVHYNGNDARALECLLDGEWAIIDVIGIPTEDLYWQVAGIDEGTKDHTIVRKDAVVGGNTDWALSAGTNADDSEWAVYDQNTFEYLGWHIEQPAYVAGTVTLDGFGEITNTEITVVVGETVYSAYPAEDGTYIIPVEPGTYEVTAFLSGYDEIIVSDVVCESGIVQVDFALIATPEALWPPVNLNATIVGSDVEVAWTAPSQYGWNGYYDGPASLTWAAGERAVFFDVADFGFSYPMELSQLSHGFYHHSAYPWGEDTQFYFKVYDADGETVLYESAVMTALEQWEDTILAFDTPLTVTDNFWVAIVTVAESGFPSSLFDSSDDLHGYLGGPGAWELYADWATTVYIEGDGEPMALSYNATKNVTNNVNDSRSIVRNNSVKITDAPTNATRDLVGFNIFRDAVQLNTELVYDISYVDVAVPAGEHTYYATAVWNYGVSAASNEAMVNLSYGNLSGTVMDGADPIVGAVITAGTYGATTDDAGAYLIENMLVGTYEVACSAAGYDNVESQTAEITDGGNTVIDFALEAGEGTIAFLDDFEAGADNWVFDVGSAWGLTEEGSHSPTHSLTESPNTDYAAGQDVSATLATPWDLSATLGAELSFWYQSDIETAFDYMYLEISTDGTEWANLATYDEEDGAWQQETISLGGFVGTGYEAVSIRFRFESDGGYETVGMLIDDVMLTIFDDDVFPPFIAHTGPAFYEGTADDYMFAATIIDISGVGEANVVYTIDGENEVIAPFTSVDGDVYTFTIPAQEAGAQVDYAIQAIDTAPEPNTALAEGYVYIAGTPFIYDNGVVDFYTVINEGAGVAEKIINPAGNQLNLAYALIRNYTDQSGQDNDNFEFHVWADEGGLPGADLITPFAVTPEASYSNTSAMTRVDLRAYATELENIQGNFFIGFLVNQGGEFGKVHCTLTDPGAFENSYGWNGTEWAIMAAKDLHFRAVAELITVTTGVVEGIVTDANGDFLEGATVTVGTASADTDEDGFYSVVADPGTQDVVCELVDYEIFNGSIDVPEGGTATMDISINMIVWAPQNLSYTYNVPNLILNWEAPTAPVQGEVLFEGFEVWPPAGWTFTDSDGDGSEWADGGETGLDAHTGTGLAYSASYTNDLGPLNPDNWLISPAVNVGGGSTVNYWVAAQDDAWAGEHYGVYVSTTGTDIADFELVFEETMIARDGAVKAGAHGTRVQGTWYERTVDISAYTGTVYVAFRHFECTDMFYLDLDDITIGESLNATRSLAGYNVYRDDVQINTDPVNSLLYVDAAPYNDAVYYVTAIYESPDGESAPSNSVVAPPDITGNDEDLVLVTELRNNYPNPFNPTTKINFSLLNDGDVTLRIYNAKGQLVKTLVNEEMESANHSVIWNGDDNSGRAVSSGVYFYRMQTKGYSSTKKMMLLK